MPNVDIGLVYELTMLCISGTAGKCFTLRDAVKALLPELFMEKTLIPDETSRVDHEEDPSEDEKNPIDQEGVGETEDGCCPSDEAETKLKLVRIQGIEPKMEIPFSWVVKNLMNPEYFLHICVCIQKVPQGKQLSHDS